jgi:hypothetical protein
MEGYMGKYHYMVAFGHPLNEHPFKTFLSKKRENIVHNQNQIYFALYTQWFNKRIYVIIQYGGYMGKYHYMVAFGHPLKEHPFKTFLSNISLKKKERIYSSQSKSNIFCLKYSKVNIRLISR